MKQVNFFLVLLLISTVAHSQTVTPNPGPYQNISTKYQYTWQKWSGGLWNLGKLIQEDSAYFKGITYVPTALDADSNNKAANTEWVRKWVSENVSPGVPGVPVSSWATAGNYTPSDPTPYRLGLKDSMPLKIITNDQIRLVIPDNGIKRNYGLANKFLVIDTTTKELYYMDGGAGSPSVVSYEKNITRDSTILTLSDGTRFAAKDSVGGGGSGSIDYVVPGFGIKVDSINRTYTVSADTNMLALKDTIKVKMPLYVSGDTLQFLKDSSYLVKNVFLKTGTDSVFKTINGVDSFAFLLPSGGSGYTVTSYGKNATLDSTILLLSDGTRYAAKDSVGGGGGVSAAGVTDDIQFNSSGAFAADTSFKFNKTGVGVANTKKYASFKLASGATAQDNGDTIVGMFIKPSYNINGKTTVKTYDINIGKNYISLDSLYNYSIGNGSAARPSGGHLIAIGFNAGLALGTTDLALMFGRQAGYLSSGADRSIFMGGNAGLNSVNSSYSNIFGVSAGSGSTVPNSNVFGASAAVNTTASYINAFGYGAGSGANGSNSSNFFGGDAVSSAGKGATGSYNSNMFGTAAGYQAVNGYYDNLFGRYAGAYSTNVNNSNMFGANAGFAVKNTTGANMFGRNTGSGADGANYSNFFGFNAGDSSTHKITGQSNILIGTNITTPSASSTNTMNIGGVLFGANFYSTYTGAPSKVAQTNGQIGINVETPNITAALEVKSTTAGVLMPRMTTTQKNAISSPAEGLMVYDLTLHKLCVYTGSAWETITSL